MYFDDFEVGSRFSVTDIGIYKDDIISFAKKYDPLQIHLDENFTKNTAYHTLIAPGIMSFMLVWADFVRSGVLNDGLLAGKNVSIEWPSPVFVGDTLSGEVYVSRKEDHGNNYGIIGLTIDVFNQTGKIVIHNTTELMMRKKRSEG